MTVVNVYLNFDGNCKQAFEFYKSVLGGDFTYVGTFGDMPPQKDMPPVSEEYKNKIMHISLPVSQETELMGSDTMPGFGPPLQVGNNYSISINTDDKKEARRIFEGLSAGGTIMMPLEETFWAALFGMFTDKFGINWMVNVNSSEEMGK